MGIGLSNTDEDIHQTSNCIWDHLYFHILFFSYQTLLITQLKMSCVQNVDRLCILYFKFLHLLLYISFFRHPNLLAFSVTEIIIQSIYFATPKTFTTKNLLRIFFKLTIFLVSCPKISILSTYKRKMRKSPLTYLFTNIQQRVKVFQSMVHYK